MAKRNDIRESVSAQAKPSKNIGKYPYTRILKVRSSFRYSQYGDFQRRRPIQKVVPVPWINIQGYWLNEVGFTIDTELDVTVSENVLIISPMYQGEDENV